MAQCRICISHCDSEFVSLLDGNSENGLSCYGKAVLTFADVSINPSDNLPKVMCNNCVKLLKDAIHFKLTCEKNYKALLDISKITSISAAPVNVVDCKVTDFVDESDTKTDVFDTKINKCDIKIDAVDEFDTDGSGDESGSSSGSCSDVDDLFEVLDSYYNTIAESPNYKCELKKTERPRANDVDAEAEFDELMMIMENNLETVIKEEVLHCGRPNIAVENANFRPNIAIGKTNVTCKVCCKVMSSKGNLEQHMKRHGVYPYICEHCGKGKASKSELRYHLFNAHKEGTFIQCELCDFKTTRRFDMLEHRRIHTGERPYACEECGLTFRRRDILRGHMKCHTGKVIKCPECPKQFSRHYDLVEHSNSIHKRVFVYSCPQCGVHYAKGSTVRRHLADKHGISREKQGRIPRVNLNAPTAPTPQ